jgi:predicted pyridoxine 5'-phosphate oxidase superfamily flavin-nucleotide-binding protein
VRIETDAQGNNTLTVPDFTGNQFFNTLGNLQVNPRAGLLFIDFDSGDLLYVAVEGEVVWDGSELAGFAGARRLMRLKVKSVQRTEALLPLRFGTAAQSPFLEATGTWS